MNTAKEQYWHEMYQRVDHSSDALGKGIDAGIAETVVALNVLGIPTTASCEGHLHHGTGAPWVDIEDPSASERSSKVGQLFQHALQVQQERSQITEEVLRLFEEAHQAREEVKRIHLIVRRKLLAYLAVFYDQRQAPYDVRLVVQARSTTGKSRLESQGADLQDVAPLDIKAQKLQEYQEEMHAFTAFLKECYFSEEDPKEG